MKRPALLISCLLASLAVNAQVYQYKDAAGRTVYSDIPPTGGTPTRTISKDPTPASGSAAPQSIADKELEFRKRQQAQKEAAQKNEKESADAANRKEDCVRAQRNLQTLESGQRVSSIDEKGERSFMDDTQRAAEIERARKMVTDLCR